MRALLCAVCVGLCAAPARGQDAPRISVRAFGEIAAERFAATQTFTSVFGRSVEPLYGGGVDATFRDRVYVELAASRFRKNADRVFRDSSGKVFNLGIPLATTLIPLELTAGYRFHLRRHPWVVPFAGAGVGWYRYRETSDFADPGENLDTQHAGLVAHGGAEFRISRWVGVAGDLQYTRVTGILGAGGLSLTAGEKDLGGVAGRIKIVVGR